MQNKTFGNARLVNNNASYATKQLYNGAGIRKACLEHVRASLRRGRDDLRRVNLNKASRLERLAEQRTHAALNA